MVKARNSSDPIVIVDDDEIEFDIFMRSFKKSSLKNPLISFTMGEDLLNYLKKVKLKLEPMPSIVLLDINMPDLSGFDVLEAIRAEGALTPRPTIVMLSGSESEKDREKAEQLGSDGFQVKPSSSLEHVKFLNALAPDLP